MKTILANGTIIYRENGKLHRVGKPAIIRADGTKYWFENGRAHRTDGPAIFRDGPPGKKGIKRWYLDNNKISFREWLTEIENRHGESFACKMKLTW